MNNNELTYWLTFTHVIGISNRRKNEIISNFINNYNIIEFYNLKENELVNACNLNSDEAKLIKESHNSLSNNSFLVEDLLNQGFELIPIISKKYPKTLKKNLKMKLSPNMLYIKGDIGLFDFDSVAIVGSRTASQNSLDFTDNIAKNCYENNQVVVSGFAKGVDKQALDSILNYGGKSIIVLPQGITTFSSSFKKYYKQLIDGDILLLSTFHPNMPWSIQNAMARNPIIYGLTNKIYVAESNDSGGTWFGVLDGLKKNREIYIRYSDENEKNANRQLIQKGGIPVNMQGDVLDDVTGNKQVELFG